MVRTLREMPDAEVVAVASPTAGRAGDFAAKWGIPTACNSVAELTEQAPDVAYVGSSNHRHLGDAEELIKAGIPVLCEKPLTTTTYEAERIVGAARKSGVFLMEAMWMVFQPFWIKLLDLLGDGAIGRLHLIRADFGIKVDPSPSRRWFSPAQGGGALLDLGVYPVTLALSLAGTPLTIDAAGTMTDTGVDAQVGMVFRHRDDVLSILDCSFLADTPVGAVISGAEGRIELEPHFHQSRRLTLHRGRHQIEHFDVGYEGSGYQFEVEEVHRCLAAGLTESTARPLDDTLEVIRVLDRVRTTAFA